MSTKLLNTDGSSAIAWSEIGRGGVTRVLRADVGAVGGRADVRAGAFRTVRRYTLRCRQATGAEVTAVAEALRESAWGAGTVRWRHPADDAAAAAADCPLFRIVDSSFTFGRGPGGVVGDIGLTLEEV